MPRNPKLRDLDLNLLVLFDAVMTTRQLTTAAKRLGMTQSAASQALGRLRSSLDDELFIRSRSGMTPTAVALALAPQIASALSTLRDALQGASGFDPATAERSFRVAFGSIGELSLLPGLLRACIDAGPGLSVVSIPGSAEEALQRVQRGEADLCMDYAPPRGPNLAHARLGDDALVVIARRGHPRIRRRVSVQRFFRERHVILCLDGDRRSRVEERINRRGLRRRVAAEASHYASIPALVLASDALAIVPRSLVAGGMLRDQLVVAPVPFDVAPLPLHAIWHEAFTGDPGHRWLRETVAASAAASPTTPCTLPPGRPRP